MSTRNHADIVSRLNMPLTEEDIIGFYKILCFRERNPENLKTLIDVCLRYDYVPHQAFLNMLDLPEVSRALEIDLIKRYSSPMPIKMNFGAVVFGYVWDQFVSGEVRRSGAWEPDVQKQIEMSLRPGDVALDIGGNIGCHSALMATIVGPTGHVHTFEPMATNIDALERMKDVNRFSQLTVHGVAVSNRSGYLALNVHSTNSGGNSVSEPGSDLRSIVRSVRLDDHLVDQLNRLDFIKIDIEGHEGPALDGAADLIRRFRPTVLMEMSPANQRSLNVDPVAVVQRFFDSDLTVEVLGSSETFHDGKSVVDYIEARSSFMDIIAKRRTH